MPVHIEELISEVTVLDGELPLSQAQLDKIADYVIAKLDQRSRDQRLSAEATMLGAGSRPGRAGRGGV